MQRHEIIATIGPASEDKETLSAFIDAGMTIARLNFSWQTPVTAAPYVEMIRSCAAEKGKKISLMQDLSGPRVQTTTGHHLDVNAEEVLTEKDMSDLSYGIDAGIEYIAISFVGSREPIDRVRAVINDSGSTARIVAKIERREALEHLDEIIDAADVVMVARGDLGDAVPIEEVPFIQHKIIKHCHAAGKPVIVATQMLLSMTEHDIPTRAEVSDVAYAIVDGATGVMLSEETAQGKHPVEAVKIMRRIVDCAEKHLQIA